MAKHRTKSINDINAQRLRILNLGAQLRDRDKENGASNKRMVEINRRVSEGHKAALRYAGNISRSKAFDRDGGNDFLTKSRAYSRKYKNYDVEGKASAVG